MPEEFYVGGLRLVYHEPEAEGVRAGSMPTVAQEPRLRTKTPMYIEYSDPDEPDAPKFVEKSDESLITERLALLVNNLSLNDRGRPTPPPVFRYSKKRGLFQACDPPTTERSGSSFRPRPGTIAVYIDGACRANGQDSARASWGHYFGPGSPYNAYGRLPPELPQTSSRAEIEALLRLLARIDTIADSLPEGLDHVWIFTDSTYVANSINCWVRDWIRAGGRKHSGQPVTHYAEWVQAYRSIKLLKDLDLIEIRVRHIRREENKGADAMASLALDSRTVANEKHFDVNVAFDKKAKLYRLHYMYSGTRLETDKLGNLPSVEKSIIAVFIAGASRKNVGSVVEFYFGPGSPYTRGVAVLDGSRSLITESRVYEKALEAADCIAGVDEVVVLTDSPELFSRVREAAAKKETADTSDRPYISKYYIKTANGQGIRLIPSTLNKVTQDRANCPWKNWPRMSLDLSKLKSFLFKLLNRSWDPDRRYIEDKTLPVLEICYRHNFEREKSAGE